MSVINLDEVGTLCLPSCLLLSPNLVLNDPFPLFSQPIFYPLDHVQYGWFFMQMSVGRSRGDCETDCLLPCTVEKLLMWQRGKKGNTFLGICSLLVFCTLTGVTGLIFCNDCEQHKARKSPICSITQLQGVTYSQCNCTHGSIQRRTMQ